MTLASIIPLDNAVESVNGLYYEGHTIIIYSVSTWMEYEMTVDWLSRHGIKYHQLMLGKPVGDVWIDDRAITCNGWDNVNKVLDEKRKK